MLRKFLRLDNWTKLVVVFLLACILAAISYGLAFSNTKLNAASSHQPGAGYVSAAGTLLLTAASRSSDTTDDASSAAQNNAAAGARVAPHRVRRRNHSPQQQHEPGHAEQQNLKCSKLRIDRLCRRHLLHLGPDQYTLRSRQSPARPHHRLPRSWLPLTPAT